MKTKELDGKCPNCSKDLIIGVDYRVEEVAEKEHGFKPDHGVNFHKLVPLHELISFHLGTASLTTKKVWGVYNELIEKFKNEFSVLLDVKKEDFDKHGFEDSLIELIMQNRNQTLKIKPGYDGVYGKIVFDRPKNTDTKKTSAAEQQTLF